MRVNEDDWRARRFGCASGSNVVGITGRSGKDKKTDKPYSEPKRAVLEIFQLWKPDAEAQKRMDKGRAAEAAVLRDAALKYGYQYLVDGQPDFVKDEEFPWLGATVDQITHDRCIEAKYKAGKLEQVWLKSWGKIPAWNLDQMMLQMRVCKRNQNDLIEASAKNIVRTILAPTAEVSAAYWAETLDIYMKFYRKYLAWYWEKDLTRAEDFKQICIEKDIPEAEWKAVLQRAITDKHEPLVNGRRPLSQDQKDFVKQKRAQALARVNKRFKERREELQRELDAKTPQPLQYAESEPERQTIKPLNETQRKRMEENRLAALARLAANNGKIRANVNARVRRAYVVGNHF